MGTSARQTVLQHLVGDGLPVGLVRAGADAGLPPDSVRYGYRSLYHRPIFTQYATTCPNAETLAATTFQLPVHPGMSEAALRWVADRIRVFAERQPS